MEIPGVDEPAVTLRRRGVDGWETRGPLTGLVEVKFPFDVRVDLSALA